MILTKSKEGEYNFQKGDYTYDLDISEISTGNFWVDWAIAFQKLCVSKLGLEVVKGPGTTIGIIQESYGPSRYQFDCDWNEKDGRLNAHPYQERGFTLWEGVSTWGEEPFSEYGIDRENKRFDFIVLFTEPSQKPETLGRRLGLRFKYPISNERGFYTSWYISSTPIVMPYYYYDDESKIDEYNNTWGINKIEITLSNARTGVVDNDILSANSYEPYFEQNTNSYTNCYRSKVFNVDEYHSWPELSENGELTYKGYLQEDFNTYSPVYYNNYIKAEIIISKNTEAVDFKIKDNNDKVLIDILFGDLVSYKENNIEYTDSFVTFNCHTEASYFSDYLITDNEVSSFTPKQVNRPNNSDSLTIQHWGISRLLLDKQILHCKELFQVFSFSELMNTNSNPIKTFIDKNGLQHDFVLFNFGKALNDSQRLKTVALAVPIT